MVTTAFARNALGAAPPVLAPGTGAQTAEEVAERIAGLLEHPVPELNTNPAHVPLVRASYEDVGAFEARARR